MHVKYINGKNIPLLPCINYIHLCNVMSCHVYGTNIPPPPFWKQYTSSTRIRFKSCPSLRKREVPPCTNVCTKRARICMLLLQSTSYAALAALATLHFMEISMRITTLGQWKRRYLREIGFVNKDKGGGRSNELEAGQRERESERVSGQIVWYYYGRYGTGTYIELSCSLCIGRVRGGRDTPPCWGIWIRQVIWLLFVWSILRGECECVRGGGRREGVSVYHFSWDKK